MILVTRKNLEHNLIFLDKDILSKGMFFFHKDKKFTITSHAVPLLGEFIYQVFPPFPFEVGDIIELNQQLMDITPQDMDTFSIVFRLLTDKEIIKPLPQSDEILKILAQIYPDNKLKIVKAYKFLCNIGLKEAKDAMDNYFMHNHEAQLAKLREEINLLTEKAKELDPNFKL